jgi:hypothetical protein
MCMRVAYYLGGILARPASRSSEEAIAIIIAMTQALILTLGATFCLLYSVAVCLLGVPC